MGQTTEPLIHQPLIPPRNGDAGEHIYASRWEALANSSSWLQNWDTPDSTNFTSMFHPYRWKAGQREATVAATIMCWLGTPCGRGFLLEARNFAENYIPRKPVDQAYLMYWAHENSRQLAINRGIRTLEYLLTPDRDKIDFTSRFPNFARIAELSGRDLEAAECVIQWLGSRAGLQFTADCEAELADQKRKDHFASPEASRSSPSTV